VRKSIRKMRCKQHPGGKIVRDREHFRGGPVSKKIEARRFGFGRIPYLAHPGWIDGVFCGGSLPWKRVGRNAPCRLLVELFSAGFG